MHGRGETRRLMQVFTDALAEDRAETRIAGLSELGLVEMTRQRLGHGLSAWQAARRPLDDPPDLSGLAEAALERALAAAASGSSARLELRAAPVLLEALGADGAALCEAFRDRTGCTLAFVPEPGFAPGRTEVAPV